MGNTKQIIQIINIILACVIVGLSVYQIVLMKPFVDLSTLKFFNFFTPFFLIVLGLMLIAAEFQAEFMTKYFKFLQNLIGRGVFNIYLSSIAVYICDTSSVLGWIFGSTLFFFGLFYIGLYFCASEATKNSLTA